MNRLARVNFALLDFLWTQVSSILGSIIAKLTAVDLVQHRAPLISSYNYETLKLLRNINLCDLCYMSILLRLSLCGAVFFSITESFVHATPDSETVSHTRKAINAFELIQKWRVEDARPEVESLLLEAPDNPFTLAVLGQFRFHLGDYAGAVEAFDEANKQGVPPNLLLDADAAQSASLATLGYKEEVGDHFIIRYPPGKDALLAPFALEALEAARTQLGHLLGWIPKERVVVEVYPAARTLAKVSALTSEDIETSGTIALCRWNRLMVTTPRAVVFGYAWRDTLAHELAHLVIGGASRDTVPIWLHEGLAKYTETAWRGAPGLGISVEQQQKLNAAVESNQLISFEEMHPSMAKLPSQEAASLAFTEVFTFVEFLVNLKGWGGIRKLLKTLGQEQLDVDQAILAVYGASLPKLEDRWKRSLLKKKIRKNKELRPTKGQKPLIVKEQPDLPDDELHGLSQLARRYARAADLLYARGRYVAAQRELEKAFTESKSPLVSAKLATMALANNDINQAEKAARRSIESMPELAGPNVTLAEILLRKKDRKGMKLPLERAIDINPFDPRIHHLTLQAEGTNGDSKVLKRAQAALKYASLTSKPNLRSQLGRGASLIVDGPPFSRVYMLKENQRISTLRITPTSAFEISPGDWTIELYPPVGKAIRRDISLKASDTPVIMRVGG